MILNIFLLNINSVYNPFFSTFIFLAFYEACAPNYIEGRWGGGRENVLTERKKESESEVAVTFAEHPLSITQSFWL